MDATLSSNANKWTTLRKLPAKFLNLVLQKKRDEYTAFETAKAAYDIERLQYNKALKDWQDVQDIFN